MDHIDSGQLGNRCVYIISELRVAVDPFTVTDEEASAVSGSVGGSRPVPAGGMPLELGGGLPRSKEDKRNRSYQPGHQRREASHRPSPP